MIKKIKGLMKIFYKAANILLIIIFAVAAGAIAYVAIPAFGNQALIVRSGSMQPVVNVGDLVVVKRQAGIESPQRGMPKYKTGDIIAFKSERNPKTLTTHRITAVESSKNGIFYTTRGDANNADDKTKVAENNIVGKSAFSIPRIGRLLAFTKSNIGFPLLVILPAILVILLEIYALFKEVKHQRRIVKVPVEKSHTLGRLAIILPISLSILVVHSSFAYFSDTETTTGNVFEAADSFGPPIAQTLVINEFLWNSSCGNNDSQKALNYWIELYNGSGSTVDLKDWRFHDANNNIIQISNAQKLLDPGKYIVITKDGSVFSGNSPCYVLQDSPEQANLGGNQNFLPTTTGGVIKLESPNGSGGFNVVDKVEYGSVLNGGVLNTAANQSIARSPNGVDSAPDDTFAPGDFAVDATPSPGVAN